MRPGGFDFGSESMTKLSASFIGVLADYDHGEGWMVIRWPHHHYGHDSLAITFDDHCFRRMPINSGSGRPEYVKLTRDHIQLHFDAELAGKLKMDEDVEFSFSISDEEFTELRRWVEFWRGDGE